jgi:hypothetical protein
MSLYSINRFVLKMKTARVLCVVGTEVLYAICMNVSHPVNKQNKISEIPNRQTKATSIRKGSGIFKFTVNGDKEFASEWCLLIHNM